MSSFLEMLTSDAGGWAPFLTLVSLKTVLLLLLAFAATSALRRASASVRHHVWTVAFGAALALPVLAYSLPAWQLAVPGWKAGLEGPPAPVAAVPTAEISAGSVARETTPRGGPTAATSSSAVPSAGSGAQARPVATFSTAALIGTAVVIWLVGASLLLLQLGLGLASAWWTRRSARPVAEGSWAALAGDVGRELGIDQPVEIRLSSRVGTPMAWGVFRPVILLPSGADSWSADRRRAVLLHELAHVKRRDCLVHLLAQAARALHWLNPLAWAGVRRLRAERERACDDLVLASGTRSADYAQLLLDVARGRMSRRLSWATVSMARPSDLEGRVLAILDPARDRRGIGRPAAVATVGLVAGVLVPLAVFQARPQPPAPPAATVAVAAGAPEPPARVATKVPAPKPAPRVRAEPPEAPDPLQERAVEAFLRALRNDRASIREQAAHGLGQLESPLAVEDLGRVARSDASAEVREQAAWALGMIESAEAVDALESALRDESTGVREQAAWALGMIESADAVDALVSALRDESAGVREQAAWALGMIESGEAVDGLIGALSSDESASVREQAAWALGMIEDRRGADALLDAIERDTEAVAEQAMWALTRILGS